jgi:hypothetical protein
MSDTGVFASRYGHLRRIGDLLDRLLLQARSHPSASLGIAKQLAELLEQMASTRASPLQELTLVMIDRPQPPVADIVNIAASLRQGDLSALVLEQLETLARSIDARLSETAAQMRGIR